MARMQKAAAIMQLKLEGQLIESHPEWQMEHRRLLHRIDRAAGTVEVDGVTYPLRDAYLPTMDPADPYALSPRGGALASNECARPFWPAKSFGTRYVGWRSCGRMYLVREGHLVFHGCVPVDEQGEYLPMMVAGQPYQGRALFEAIEREVYRLIDGPSVAPKDLDLFWYLWSGPQSPLFGKDRITTFERDLIADPRTHHETQKPILSTYPRRVVLRQGLVRIRSRSRRGHDRQWTRAREGRKRRVAL